MHLKSIHRKALEAGKEASGICQLRSFRQYSDGVTPSCWQEKDMDRIEAFK